MVGGALLRGLNEQQFSAFGKRGSFSLEREQTMRRVAAAAIALVLGYGAGLGAQWLLRVALLRDESGTQLMQEWVLRSFGHYVIALTVVFGLPLLLLEAGRVLQSTWKAVLTGGVLLGVCMAGGVALLFAVLIQGRGVGLFVGSVLLFGGVAGLVACVVFRVVAGRVAGTVLETPREASVMKRVGIAAGAVVASGGLVCVLLLVITALFDHRHPLGWWVPIYRYLAVFLAAGWLVFGLPLLVLGPARERFAAAGDAAVAGGVASVVFVECYFQSMFAGGWSWDAVAFHLGFAVLAFLIGAMTGYWCAEWPGKLARRARELPEVRRGR